jgi:hypothetical protein
MKKKYNFKKKDFVYPNIPLKEVKISNTKYLVGTPEGYHVPLFELKKGKAVSNTPTMEMPYNQYSDHCINERNQWKGDKNEKKGKMTNEAQKKIQKRKDSEFRTMLWVVAIIMFVLILKIFLNIQ